MKIRVMIRKDGKIRKNRNDITRASRNDERESGNDKIDNDGRY